MSLFDANIKEVVKKFPDSPGVYLMKNEKAEIIYVGKATSLRKRVGSYFNRALNTKTEKLVSDIRGIDFKMTESAMEALILEANLISLYKPYYNIKLKDDKYFVNIIITEEKFPRILIARASDEKKQKTKNIFGPYTSKRDAKQVIDLLVKIFCSRRDKSSSSTENLYLRYYIKGYSSGKIGSIAEKDYKKIIYNIKSFLEGRKEKIIKKAEKEMLSAAKRSEFEKAAQLRDQIFALQHIRDTAFMDKEDLLLEKQSTDFDRIEGYDISNTSGKDAVGSMVVFRRNKPDKDEYRKFKIKTVQGANDIAMMKEILERRFGNGHDWQLPDLIIMDGGMTQTNAAKTVLKKHRLTIPIVGIAKGPDRKGEKLFFSAPKGFVFPDIDLIKKVRDESHRFAINYHRKLRGERIKGKKI
ncbi:MAG: UvrB/UvrC motif-containing protein [Candidatus Pacebacteria bacterium]|nr:UvrB/UvrC motif-containing protein [Candidatus Paceibacterota bacterium]